MANYTLHAEPAAFNLTGQDVTLRHLVRLQDDDPVLAKLGSISSNYPEVERFFRDAIEMVDSEAGKPLTVGVAKENQLARIGKVLRKGLTANGCSAELLPRFDAFMVRLGELQAKRHRLAHDALRRDKKTNELVRFATSGAKKVVVVTEIEVDELVGGFRQLVNEINELRGTIWRHMNP